MVLSPMISNVRAARVFAGVAVAGLTACPANTRVWVHERSTQHHLQFDLGRQRGHRTDIGVIGFRVYHCVQPGYIPPSAVVWQVSARQGVDLDSIVYAHVPTGFVETKRAATLKPGCYGMGLDSGGEVTFLVNADGTIKVVSTIE